MNFSELCQKIISIDSTPSVGNAAVAEWCADLCKKSGFEVTLQEASLLGKKQYNLIARPEKSKKKNEVIFQTHLDTVEPGPLGHWTKTDHNAFKAHIEDDKIFGLGTADVKLDFLCKWRALKEFVSTPMKRPFVLIGTYGEEIGMHGAHKILESKAVDAKMAIIGEPSELQVVYANNGLLVIDFFIEFSDIENNHRENHDQSQEKVFHGKAAHSSTPHLGDNAIYKLIQYLEKMPENMALIKAHGGSAVNTVPSDAFVEVDASFTCQDSAGARLVKLVKFFQKLERDFLAYEDEAFKPSHPTLNVGLLKTEEKGLALTVSFRITPQVSDEEIQGWIEKIEVNASAIGCKVDVKRLSPPAITSLDSELVRGALDISGKLGLSTKPITKASGTEASVYSHAGIECIVFGPGVSIGNSHTANEYNFLTQLDTATEYYKNCIKRFCL